jgi:hypothetical protein
VRAKPYPLQDENLVKIATGLAEFVRRVTNERVVEVGKVLLRPVPERTERQQTSAGV